MLRKRELIASGIMSVSAPECASYVCDCRNSREFYAYFFIINVIVEVSVFPEIRCFIRIVIFNKNITVRDRIQDAPQL